MEVLTSLMPFTLQLQGYMRLPMEGWRFCMEMNFGTDGLCNCLMKYVAGAGGQ